jgi:hypothetical protein
VRAVVITVFTVAGASNCGDGDGGGGGDHPHFLGPDCR